MSFQTLVTSERGIGGFVYPCYNAGSADLLMGQPVMRRYPLTYAGGVGHPAGAGGLGEFAGILTRKILSGNIGDIASSAMVMEGEVKATVYVDGTPSTYTAGAQLAPFWDSTNGAYLKRVAYQTGITLLEDWSGKTASTLYSQATGLGALVEIAPQATCRNGLSHYAWSGLVAADADYFLAAQATSASAVTTVLTAGMLNSGTPDFARNVVITPGGTTADVPAGDVVVTGLDIYGATITENFTFAANATGAVTGNKAFASLTSIVFPIQDGAAATYNVGTGVKLGLARPFAYAPVTVQAKAAGTVEGTAPTVAVSATAVSGNTVSFNTAPNGGLREIWLHAA